MPCTLFSLLMLILFASISYYARSCGFEVKVVLINIFGGITRCDDVAMGLLQTFEQINSNVPVIVRLTGTNEHIGRELLRNYSRFQIATTMKEAALMALKA